MAGEANSEQTGAGALKLWIARMAELHRVPREDPALAEAVTELRRWQSQRLQHTHADLMGDRRFRPAVEFFLEELYGPKDFSKRDADIARVYPLMVRALPDEALVALSRALELNVLSHELDLRLIEQLPTLAAAHQLTAAGYCEAYRRCDNYPERRLQIELIRQLGSDLERIVHQRFIGTALKLARRPARLAGFADLQVFLERGYTAFRHMKRPEEFIDTVVGRELALLDQIYAGSNDLTPAPEQ